MFRESRYRCQDCQGVFGATAIVADARDDRRCPACGGLRLQRVVSRLERIQAFLLDYEKV